MALECLQDGSIDVEPLVSARVSLSEDGAWMERLYGGESGLVKVVLEPEK